jgi:hypothetical protein
VTAERLPATVSVEQWREHPERQRGGHEQGVSFEGRQDQIAELAGNGVILRQLGIVFHTRRLMARRHAAVDPVGRLEQPTRMHHLLRRQNIGNFQDHRARTSAPD